MTFKSPSAAFKMFTANLAGTSGSHIRTDRDHHHHRDSLNQSRQNLHEIDGGSEEDVKRHLQVKRFSDEYSGSNNERKYDPSDRERGQTNGVQENQRKSNCIRDWKNWAYLLCVILVIIGALVLIILAGTGILSPTGDGS